MSVEPFWQPEQYSESLRCIFYHISQRITSDLVPIVGMLAGSTISGMVVALTAILREVQENRDKVETYLAFGASRIEASMPIAQQALLIALTPVVNQMRYAHLFRERCSGLSREYTDSVIGIIAIPGMMTGALLGGSSVEQAARLQSKVTLFIIKMLTNDGFSDYYVLHQC